MKKLLLAAAFAASTAPASAHHPLGGMPMDTFADGVLSGVGHPILGFDHLFFIVIVGIAALFTGRPMLAPLAYIGAMLVGCLLTSTGTVIPWTEIIIGLSLLIVGSIVLSGRALGFAQAAALFAVFGFFHGSAFGGSIAEQEAAVGGQVLIGYLIGLGIVQYLIAIVAGRVTKTAFEAREAPAIQVRLAGAVVAGIGLFLTLENAEGVVFDLLSWTA